MGTGVGAAISDAGPIIHLHEVGVLPLLRLFDSVHVPGEVWKETVGKDRVSATHLRSLGSLQRHNVDSTDLRVLIEANDLDHLQKGEQECLLLLSQQSPTLVLTDDLAVRDAVHDLGGTPVGSLGIIVRACRESLINISDAERLLRELYGESTLFVTEALVERAIEQIRKNL